MLPVRTPGERYKYLFGCLHCRGVYSISGFSRHWCLTTSPFDYKLAHGTLSMKRALSTLNAGTKRIFMWTEEKDKAAKLEEEEEEEEQHNMNH